MKVCTNCRLQYSDSVNVCTQCGGVLQQIPAQFRQTPPVSAPVPAASTDHTAEFNPQDISDNKVFAMLPYMGMLNIVGIIIALLAAPSSPYTMFHVRQGLKIFVSQILASICLGALFVFDAILAGLARSLGFAVALLVIFTLIVFAVNVYFLVAQILGFIWVCKGQAKEPPIISSLAIMK